MDENKNQHNCKKKHRKNTNNNTENTQKHNQFLNISNFLIFFVENGASHINEYD